MANARGAIYEWLDPLNVVLKFRVRAKLTPSNEKENLAVSTGVIRYPTKEFKGNEGEGLGHVFHMMYPKTCCGF